MRKNCVKVTVSIGLLLFVSTTILRAKSPTDSSAESASIKQVVADWSSAFDRHDAHDISALYTEDADFTNGRGMTYHGRKEIEQLFTTLFGAGLKNAHRTANIKAIRYLTPDIASVECDSEMTGSKAPDGSENPVRRGYIALTLMHQKHRWLISVFHEEFDPPPAR